MNTDKALNHEVKVLDSIGAACYTRTLILVNHLDGEVRSERLGLEKLRNQRLYGDTDQIIAKFEATMSLPDNDLVELTKKDFLHLLEGMKQEEDTGYPDLFYRSSELGELVCSILQGAIDNKPSGKRTATYSLSHYTKMFPAPRSEFVYEIRHPIPEEDQGLVTINRSHVSVPPLELGTRKFPNNYEVTINPRSVGVHILPEQAKRYAHILGQKGKKIKLIPLLKTIGEIVNNSIVHTHYNDIERPNTERLPAEPNQPPVVIQEQSEGYCIDAGVMIRRMLCNLGLPSHVRIKGHTVPTPLPRELGHDVTGIHDIKNGYAIFIDSKEGNFEHPLLLDYDQLTKRFCDGKKYLL